MISFQEFDYGLGVEVVVCVVVVVEVAPLGATGESGDAVVVLSSVVVVLVEAVGIESSLLPAQSARVNSARAAADEGTRFFMKR